MTWDTEKLLTLWRGLPSDEARAERLAAAEGIRANVMRLEKVRIETERRHKAELAGISADLRMTQAECPHWLTTYHAHPVDSSDSWTECDLCGAELPRRWTAAAEDLR